MLQSIRSETVVWGLSGFYVGLATIIAIRRSLRPDEPSKKVIGTEWLKEMLFTAGLLAIALLVMSKGYPRLAIAVNAIPLVMAAIIAIFAYIWVSDEAKAKHPERADAMMQDHTGESPEENFEIHRSPARDHHRPLAPRA